MNEVDGETRRDQLGEAQGKLQSKLPTRKKYLARSQKIFPYQVDDNRMDVLSNSLLIRHFSFTVSEATAIGSMIIRCLLNTTSKINHPSQLLY